MTYPHVQRDLLYNVPLSAKRERCKIPNAGPYSGPVAHIFDLSRTGFASVLKY